MPEYDLDESGKVDLAQYRIPPYESETSPYNRDSLAEWEDSDTEPDGADDSTDRDVSEDDDTGSKPWTVSRLAEVEVQLFSWGRIQNPLKAKYAREIACLRFAEPPTEDELEKEINFIESIDSLNVVRTYKSYGDLNSGDPMYRQFHPKGSRFFPTSKIAQWVRGDQGAKYCDPPEAFDIRWEDDGPEDIICADYEFNRGLLGNPKHVPTDSKAIAEIFASAIQYPTKLKIWQLYINIVREKLNSGHRLLDLVLPRREPPLKELDVNNHVWAALENRALFKEVRKVRDWFYIEAFDLSENPMLAEGPFACPEEDPTGEFSIEGVPQYWKFWVSRDISGPVNTQQKPAKVPELGTADLNPLLNSAPSAATEWTSTQRARWATDRTGEEWDDGIRGWTGSDKKNTELLRQRHDNIPYNQLRNDNLPAFFRKLTCKQAGDLVRALKEGKVKDLTQSQAKEYWPEDLDSGGKLQAKRKPWADSYHGTDLGALAPAGTNIGGSDITDKTPWEQKCPRTFTSAGRFMVEDVDFRLPARKQATVYQTQISRLESEISALKRKAAEPPTPIASKRLRTSSISSTVSERGRTNKELAARDRDISKLKSANAKLIADAAADAEYHATQLAELNEELNIARDGMKDQNDLGAEKQAFEENNQEVTALCSLLKMTVEAFQARLSKSQQGLKPDLRYDLQALDYRNPRLQPIIEDIFGRAMPEKLGLAPTGPQPEPYHGDSEENTILAALAGLLGPGEAEPAMRRAREEMSDWETRPTAAEIIDWAGGSAQAKEMYKLYRPANVEWLMYWARHTKKMNRQTPFSQCADTALAILETVLRIKVEMPFQIQSTIPYFTTRLNQGASVAQAELATRQEFGGPPKSRAGIIHWVFRDQTPTETEHIELLESIFRLKQQDPAITDKRAARAAYYNIAKHALDTLQQEKGLPSEDLTRDMFDHEFSDLSSPEKDIGQAQEVAKTMLRQQEMHLEIKAFGIPDTPHGNPARKAPHLHYARKYRAQIMTDKGCGEEDATEMVKQEISKYLEDHVLAPWMGKGWTHLATDGNEPEEEESQDKVPEEEIF